MSMQVKRKSHRGHLICNRLVKKCSFHHNLNCVSEQKNYLIKVVQEYSLMKLMPCRTLNLELFVHKMSISSQEFFQREPESCNLVEQNF